MKHFFTRKNFSFLLILGFLGLFSGTQAQQNFQLMLKSGPQLPPENFAEISARQSAGVNAVEYGFVHKVIQFYQIPGSAQRAELEKQGLRFVEYLPHNAYVVALPNGFDLASLRNHQVRSLLDLSPNMKMQPALLERPFPAYALRGANKIGVVLSYYPTVDRALVMGRVQDFAAGEVNSFSDFRRVEMTLRVADLEKLAGEEWVHYLELVAPPAQPENYTARNLHRSTSISTNKEFGAGRKYDGTGVVVAMGDDGPIGPHLDYHGRTDQSQVNQDNGNHGDHVAGTIMGAGNLNPLHKGMAPGAELHVYSVWNAVDNSPTHHNTKGVMITSTSYSNGCNAGYTNRARNADQSIRQNPALIHIFSAGNSNNQDCGYGAGNQWGNVTGGIKVGKNVVAVANVTSTGSIANSSSRGPASDGRIKPEVSAKGTSVISPVDENQYANFTGTSMSCPGVSGTTAQLYHAYRDLNNGDDPEAGLMRGLLMNTAAEVGSAGPDFIYGYGIINALDAVEVIEANQFMFDSADQGDTNVHTITVPAGVSELKVMLSWTDYEASAGASVALVNNLDFEVDDPSASTTLPWVLDPTPNTSTLNAPATQGVDDLNNMEQVTIESPAPGTYTLRVMGKVVPQGPQKYWINYIMRDSSVKLTYPIGGEYFVPNEDEVIRWDAAGNWGTFDGEYSTDGGATWNSLFTGQPANRRYFLWSNPPSVATGDARIRITRGNWSDMGDGPFNIIRTPTNFRVERSCPNEVTLKWSAQTGATAYEVSMLGSMYMDSIGTTTADSIVLTGLNQNDTYWFAVKSLGPNGAVGQRTVAISRPPGVFNCLDPNDVAVSTVTAPGNGVIMDCGESDLPVTVELTNYSPNDVTNIPVSYVFGTQGGTVVTETYTDTLKAYATDLFTFTTATVSLSTGSNDIWAWTGFAPDNNTANDSAYANSNLIPSQVKTLPYTQDFEQFPLCGTSSNCESVNCQTADDWYNSQNIAVDDMDWRAHAGNTPSSAFGPTGPSQDHNPGSSLGKYMYLEASSCFEKEGHLISPCIDLDGAIAPEASFWFHLNGADMGELHVDLLVDGQWIMDVTGAMTANWYDIWWERRIDLTPYAGKKVSIRWRGITGDDFLSDMAIDDISFYDTQVSIEEELSSTKLRVYPNPSKGFYNLAIDEQGAREVNLLVTDMQGRVVYRRQGNFRNGQYYHRMDLSSLSMGMYSLKVTVDGKAPKHVKISKM